MLSFSFVKMTLDFEKWRIKVLYIQNVSILDMDY